MIDTSRYTLQEQMILQFLKSIPGHWFSLRSILNRCPCNTPTKPLSILYDKGNGAIEKRRDPEKPTQMQYRAKA